ncbi:DDE-type integrase/transposase/recombinase, partial [Lysobacter sp. A3-1-A15]|uniref:DDE-type integrase/transposase/recombinase n=1 Tax=Novilysobacter viscosus TaxID=3098602 RepID=UPI002EDB227B
LQLAIILDAHTRAVVGWAMAEHQRLELAEHAMDMALVRRQPKAGLILHHDRGSQYTGARYRGRFHTIDATHG